MKVSRENGENQQVILTIEASAEEWGKAIADAAKRIAKEVNIPGFRRGKAPRRIVEQRVGKEALIDEAYEKIAHFELEDPTLYKKLVKRIKIESIFMRYLECTLYAYSYSPEELKEIRTSFCNDCIELDIFDYREHDGDMSVIFAGWGL